MRRGELHTEVQWEDGSTPRNANTAWFCPPGPRAIEFPKRNCGPVIPASPMRPEKLSGSVPCKDSRCAASMGCGCEAPPKPGWLRRDCSAVGNWGGATALAARKGRRWGFDSLGLSRTTTNNGV